MIILIKAVIFDIGGVTIKYPMDGIYHDIEKEFKISKKTIKKIYEKLEPLISTDKISEKEFWLNLAKYLEIKDVNTFKKVWMNSLKKHGTLNHDVVKIIKNVKKNGYIVAALSNVPTPHERLHRKLGHYKFFNRVFLSTKLRMKKPDVKIYQYVAGKLGVRPEECIFIDDKMDNVIGARKAGMKAILFNSAAQLEKKLKNYL
ncbi:MAG: HAD family phosphatase [Candidatus Aenigmatarchaeota archaeon]